MQQLPKISIIIPVYNVAEYITECLQSVMRQTYMGVIECILVDDCGKDDSVAIAEQLIVDYKGSIEFSILHHEHNRGLSAARNTGTKAATGDFIYYLDSDDTICPKTIQVLVEQVRKHPDVLCVIGCTQSSALAWYFDTSRWKSTPFVEDNISIRENVYVLANEIPVTGWDKLIDLKFLKENNLFFKEGILHEDRHWWFYMAKHLDCIAFVFEPTYVYRDNGNSIMSTQTVEREAKHYKTIVFDWARHCDGTCRSAQLQYILMHFSRHQVYLPCTREECVDFVEQVLRMLKSEKQYKSYMYLSLWKVIQPLRNIKKLLRYSYENIKIQPRKQ